VDDSHNEAEQRSPFACPKGKRLRVHVAGLEDKEFPFEDKYAEVWLDLSGCIGWRAEHPAYLDEMDEVRACTEELYQYPNDGWILVIDDYVLDTPLTSEPIAHEINDARAVNWLLRNDFDVPDELADVERALIHPGPTGNREPTRNRPSWDAMAGTLRYGNEVVRTVAKNARNVRPLLDAFEAQRWPDRIDPPPHFRDDSTGQQLRDAWRQLNKGLKKLTFAADAHGTGVIWTVND
jgi:hypothetical protein